MWAERWHSIIINSASRDLNSSLLRCLPTPKPLSSMCIRKRLWHVLWTEQGSQDKLYDRKTGISEGMKQFFIWSNVHIDNIQLLCRVLNESKRHWYHYLRNQSYSIVSLPATSCIAWCAGQSDLFFLLP